VQRFDDLAQSRHSHAASGHLGHRIGGGHSVQKQAFDQLILSVGGQPQGAQLLGDARPANASAVVRDLNQELIALVTCAERERGL